LRLQAKIMLSSPSAGDTATRQSSTSDVIASCHAVQTDAIDTRTFSLDGAATCQRSARAICPTTSGGSSTHQSIHQGGGGGGRDIGGGGNDRSGAAPPAVHTRNRRALQISPARFGREQCGKHPNAKQLT